MTMVRESRARKPDAYLVPFPSNRWQYSLLAATSGARRRILHGYPIGRWRALHFLPSTRVPAVRGIHDVEQNLRLLEPLGLAPDDKPHPPVFRLSDHERAGAMLAFSKQERWIIVHAGSAQTVLAQAKRWPTEKYRELIRALRNELGERIVVVEGPDEAGMANEIVGDTGAAYPFKLSGPLGEAAALLERAELYVGTDSGLAHLAAAVGTPAVTIFAPADPDRVCPYGYRHLVVQPPPPCDKPSFLYPWESTYPKLRGGDSERCIERVTVESVMATVRRALQERAAAR
jgi:ADP-heptose:LPS heptosyltransferase